MNKDTCERPVTAPDIDSVHFDYIQKIESLKVFVRSMAPVGNEHDDRVLAQVQKKTAYLNRVFDSADKRGHLEKSAKGDELTLKLTRKEAIRLQSALKFLESAPHSLSKVLHESAFMMLISHFYFLLSNLMHFYYSHYPESLSSLKIPLTMKDLRSTDSVADLCSRVIEQQIEQIGYKSLSEQVVYFRENLSLDLNRTTTDWNLIFEAVQRRNILVHNSGIVNNTYFRLIDFDALSRHTKRPSLGDSISVPPDYFSRVLDEIYVTGVIAVQLAWRKWQSDRLESANGAVLEHVYRLLCQEEWAIAERIAGIAHTWPISDSRVAIALRINYLQSLKWQGKKQELRKGFQAFDTKSLSPLYRMAEAVLSDNVEGCYKFLKASAMSGEIEKKDVYEWPLFREIRQRREFDQSIQSIFRSAARAKAKQKRVSR